MNLKKKLFENFNLYAVTSFDKPCADALTMIDKAYRGGAGIVQLRAPGLSDLEFYRLGLKARQISRHYGRGFVVNNRLEIALACDADAIHVGQNDLPIEVIREILQKQDSQMAIGKSTHSVEQAREAEEQGADYIGVGPVYTTPTKPNYAPVGLELVHQVKRSIRIPFVAIGGINESNLNAVVEAGASAIAAVRAIFAAADIMEATKSLKDKFEKARSLYV